MTSIASKERYTVDVAVPYRLDLTVTVLRRLSTNIVDVLTPQGQYLRTLAGFRSPVVARVAQTRPDALAVTIEGATAEHIQALATVRRMLGVVRDLSHFDRAARGVPWLRAPGDPHARREDRLRYPTLWEACVNAIVFSASEPRRSLFLDLAADEIMALGARIERRRHVALRAFPSLASFQGASDNVLRSAGLSANKLAALRGVAGALLSGALDEVSLEQRPSPDAAAMLGRIKGIGPWTATVILLRGLGRLDVFPMNDTSVARNLAFVAGAAAPIDVARVLAALGPQRGMLYYHLLLARLEARGEVGRASVACGASGR